MFDGIPLERVGIIMATNPLPADLFSHLSGTIRSVELSQNQFETLPQHIFKGLPKLNRVYMWSNRLKDLPDMPTLTYDPQYGGGYTNIQRNCINKRDARPETIAWLDKNVGTGWEKQQSLCMRLEYSPAKPSTGLLMGPVEATISFYGPEAMEDSFVLENSGALTYSFSKNGEYTFNFSGAEKKEVLYTPVSRGVIPDYDMLALPQHPRNLTASVDWINELFDISYDTVTPTSGDVVATIAFNVS
jgi:hypothetical protein